jgi:rhomboid protease GluP
MIERPDDDPLEISAEMLHADSGVPRETRRDFEKGMSYAPAVSLALIVVNLIVFMWMLGTGKLASAAALLSAGAMDRDAVVAGQIWRLVTYMFLHGGIEHLLSNTFMLYVLGMGCEHAFGRTRTALLYVISGIAGGVASGALTATVSVGASGAIFGLAGALIVALHRHRDTFYLRDKRIAVVVLIWALYTIGVGFLSVEIDNWCHIGGFLAGAVTGWFLPMREMRQEAGFFVIPSPSPK